MLLSQSEIHLSCTVTPPHPSTENFKPETLSPAVVIKMIHLLLIISIICCSRLSSRIYFFHFHSWFIYKKMLFKFTDKKLLTLNVTEPKAEIYNFFLQKTKTVNLLMLLLPCFSKRIIEIVLTIKCFTTEKTHGDGDACVRNWMWFFKIWYIILGGLLFKEYSAPSILTMKVLNSFSFIVNRLEFLFLLVFLFLLFIDYLRKLRDFIF